MTSSTQGTDLLVGWDSTTNKEEEEGQEEEAMSEKSPLAAASTATENDGDSPKRTRRWGISRIPKEEDDISSEDSRNYDKSADIDDSIFSSKSHGDHCLDSAQGKGMEDNENDDSCNDSDSNDKSDQYHDTNYGFNGKVNYKQREGDGDIEYGNEENEIESNELSNIIGGPKQQQEQPKGIWQRISSLGIKQDGEENGSDSVIGLLKDGSMNGNINNANDVRGEELIVDNSIDDILVRRLSQKNNENDFLVKRLSNKSNESTQSKTLAQAIDYTQNNPVKGSNSNSASANGTKYDSEKEVFEMKNPIEGFGSNKLEPSSQSHPKSNINNTSTNPLTSGINSFFQAIQLRRIKARHEFDPFSLTAEELEILKQDILCRQHDLDSMEQMKIDGEKSKPKDTLKESVKNIQSAVLAPEAFSAYTDRKIDEEDGEDNMGHYMNVPLGGEDDIYDDYELRQKKMKPMKMEGDDITWGDIVEEMCDPDGFVIDENTYLEDVDPMGAYRGLPPKCDDDDDSVDGAKEKNSTEDAKEMKKLRGEIQSLTEKIQNLVKELQAKDKETQKWREKALELEKDLEELKREDAAVNKDVDFFMPQD